MTVKAKSLFQQFTQLAESDKKDFIKQALSYFLDDKEELDDVTLNQITEAKSRMEAFEAGDLQAVSSRQVEKRLELKYGLSN